MKRRKLGHNEGHKITANKRATGALYSDKSKFIPSLSQQTFPECCVGRKDTGMRKRGSVLLKLSADPWVLFWAVLG